MSMSTPSVYLQMLFHLVLAEMLRVGLEGRSSYYSVFWTICGLSSPYIEPYKTLFSSATQMIYKKQGPLRSSILLIGFTVTLKCIFAPNTDLFTGLWLCLTLLWGAMISKTHYWIGSYNYKALLKSYSTTPRIHGHKVSFLVII